MNTCCNSQLAGASDISFLIMYTSVWLTLDNDMGLEVWKTRMVDVDVTKAWLSTAIVQPSHSKPVLFDNHISFDWGGLCVDISDIGTGQPYHTWSCRKDVWSHWHAVNTSINWKDKWDEGAFSVFYCFCTLWAIFKHGFRCSLAVWWGMTVSTTLTSTMPPPVVAKHVGCPSQAWNTCSQVLLALYHQYSRESKCDTV